MAPVKIEPGTLVNLADVGAVRVSGEGVKAGAFARLTLTFDTGQTSEVNAPIVPKVGLLLRGQAGDPVAVTSLPRPRRAP